MTLEFQSRSREASCEVLLAQGVHINAQFQSFKYILARI